MRILALCQIPTDAQSKPWHPLPIPLLYPMFKPKPLLLCSIISSAAILSAAQLFAQGEDRPGDAAFSPTDGDLVEWEKELPARYLLSFEFRNDPCSSGKAKITHDGHELFNLAGEGDWQSAQIAVDTEAGLSSSWLDGKVLTEETVFRKPQAQTTPAGRSSSKWQSDADAGKEIYSLTGDFTIAARFRTKAGGTIVSKCAPQGKWTPDSKALFVKGGRLVYDIGWKGAVRTRKKIDDDKWHHVVLVYRHKPQAIFGEEVVDDGVGTDKLRIFVDGELAAEEAKFTAPDPDGSVLKIGSAATDFGGDYKGDIDYVRFWRRALPDEEIAALGKGDEAKTNTPLLNWMPSGVLEKEKLVEPNRPDDGKSGLRFYAIGGQLNFRRCRVEPLAEVDHARLIRAWDHLSLERGARIYNGLCITCHGDQKIEGTLPTALRFHSGEFKNGKDPLSMYNTLTNGFNLMVAQPWMTPTQKYDVIHYIRETFIKKDNPKQFVEVDDAYLDGLPRGIGIGSTKATLFADGEAPKYQKMDFGPALFWTLEAEPGNIAYKGIAVRLDEGPGGVSKGNKWLLYDHDTMRVAAAWTGEGFVNWRGIAFDQSHNSHTSIVGDIAFTNPVGPGWGRPADGSFEEVRFRGRDGKPYGPLPRDWAHYEGLFLHGNRAVLNYTVGDAAVHELPGYEMHAGETIFTRNLNIAKSSADLKLRIAPAKMAVARIGGGELSVDDDGFHVLEIPASATPVSVKVLSAAFEDQDVLDAYAESSGDPIELGSLMTGGERRWPGLIETEGKMGDAMGPSRSTRSSSRGTTAARGTAGCASVDSTFSPTANGRR